MKKIIVLILATIALHHQVWSQCDIPAKKPGVYVQDHVDKLSSNEERTLEAKIQNYRQKTGIQICIALVETTGDCDGETYARELANTYGVGEKNVNNGLTIMVAWNHKWFIKTGYTTESYITDYEAVNIGEANLVPNLRENKVYQAINTTLDACIQEMGWQTWDERITARKKAEQEAAARAQNFWIWVGCIIGLILLLWLGIWIYRREQKRNKIRNQLSSWRKQIKDNWPAIKTLGWPNWAAKELSGLNKQLETSWAEFDRLEGRILANIDDVDSAYNEMSAMERGCVRSINSLLEQINALPGRMKQYENEAASKVKTTLATIRSFKNGDFDAATKKGFKFTQWESQLGQHITDLQKWQEQFGSQVQPDDYRTGFETATQLATAFATITTAFASLMANYQTINAQTKDWQGRIAKIRADNTSASILSQLQAGYANNVWQELKKQFDAWQSKLAAAEKSLETAVAKNSLQKQDFAGAWSDYQTATTAISAIEDLFTTIGQTLEQQKASAAAYEGKRSTANSAISTARSKCSDSDVESRAKSYLSEAESLYRSATSAASGKTDWVTICNQLDRAKNKGDEAYNQACRDISDAEDARRRRREEEERQRQAAYSSSSSSSSWSSSSSDSGSSFGGGSSGGGGGGGSW